MKNKPDLVLGAVRGYNFEQLRPFIISLRQTAFEGDIVLLWNEISPDTITALKDHGVILFFFEYRGSGAENSWSRFWPQLRPLMNLPCGNALRRFVYRKILNLAFVRFVHQLDFLEKNVDRYNNVLLTDVRDVFFQDNPFHHPLPAPLVAFLEAPKMIFGQEPRFNDPWIKANYDATTLERLSSFGVSCCGTIMGTAPAMVDYLRAFVGEIRKLNSLAHGADTSIHNVLVRFDPALKFEVKANLEGAVGTLGNEEFEYLKFNDKGLILDKNGEPIPVIHQYEPQKFIAVLKALGVS